MCGSCDWCRSNFQTFEGKAEHGHPLFSGLGGSYGWHLFLKRPISRAKWFETLILVSDKLLSSFASGGFLISEEQENTVALVGHLGEMESLSLSSADVFVIRIDLDNCSSRRSKSLSSAE